MLEPIPIDLAGQRPLPERTAAIKATLATLDAAKPKHAPATPRPTSSSRVLRNLIASFKPPPRDQSVPPLHSLERGLGGEVDPPSPFAERAIAKQGGEVERPPPALATA